MPLERQMEYLLPTGGQRTHDDRQQQHLRDHAAKPVHERLALLSRRLDHEIGSVRQQPLCLAQLLLQRGRVRVPLEFCVSVHS